MRAAWLLFLGLLCASAWGQTVPVPGAPSTPPPANTPEQSLPAPTTAPSSALPAAERVKDGHSTPNNGGAGGSGEITPIHPAASALPSTGQVAGLDTDHADPNTSLILDNADTFRQDTAGLWTADGHVKVRYQGYVLTADKLETDLDAGDAKFSGNVVLNAPDGRVVRGGPDGMLQLNLRRGTYSVTGARTTVPPETVPVGIILPLFVYGGTISGRPGLIDARGSQFTTCDFLSPHYFFSARRVSITPGKVLVARNVSLYRKNRRVFALPYLIVPLNDRYQQQTLFPQVGQSPDEGYFVKFALGYAVLRTLPGILHLDFLQRKGIGTGFDQTYGPAANGVGVTGLAALNNVSAGHAGSGTVSLYRLYDRTTGLENITGNLEHTQSFGTVNLDLTSSLQQNSYYQGDGQSRSTSTQIDLSRAVGNLNSSLHTNIQQSDYGDGATKNITSTLGNVFSPTAAQQLTTNFAFSQYVTPGILGIGGTDQQTLTSDIDYALKGKVVDLEILGDKNTSVHNGGSSGVTGFFGGGGTSFSGVERLPEVRLATDAVRLRDLAAFLPRTTRLSLSLGAFRELTSVTPSEQQRARFGLDLGQNTRRFDRRNSLDYGGSFQQGVYGDGAEQYVLNGRTGYRMLVGRGSSLGFGYTYIRPYGYTPFQFDYAGSSNLATAALSVQETKTVRLSVGTGFDFGHTKGQYGQTPTPWQNVAFQALLAPRGDAFLFRTTTSYDLNHNRLLDITNGLRARGAGTFAVDLTSRYSPMLHKFSAVNGDLDLPFFRDPNPAEDAGYRLRGIGGFDGLTNKFDYKGLALTRSWHDYEATLIYQDTPGGLRPGSTVTFNLRLKAFPDKEPFGIGQFGQSLDTGLGAVY